MLIKSRIVRVRQPVVYLNVKIHVSRDRRVLEFILPASICVCVIDGSVYGWRDVLESLQYTWLEVLLLGVFFVDSGTSHDPDIIFLTPSPRQWSRA